MDDSVNLCIRKFESFKTPQELVRGSSNRLGANMYWMVAFKVLVFDASLFEERQTEVVLRFGNHFYQEYFLKVDQEWLPFI